MEWYNILFFCVLIFFIVKTLITVIFGDIDIDFDFDGDIDFDISSMFSFKGILHFLLGFSSYLAIIAKFYSTPGVLYQFQWYHYVIAFCIGIIFMVVLFDLYKLMMKLNHFNSNNIDVNNYNCSILIDNGIVDNDNKIFGYTVLVNTEVGSRKISVLSDKNNLAIGSEHKIYKNEQGIYYI